MWCYPCSCGVSQGVMTQRKEGESKASGVTRKKGIHTVNQMPTFPRRTVSLFPVPPHPCLLFGLLYCSREPCPLPSLYSSLPNSSSSPLFLPQHPSPLLSTEYKSRIKCHWIKCRLTKCHWTKCHWTKMSSDKMSPDKMSPDNVTGQKVTK